MDQGSAHGGSGVTMSHVNVYYAIECIYIHAGSGSISPVLHEASNS